MSKLAERHALPSRGEGSWCDMPSCRCWSGPLWWSHATCHCGARTPEPLPSNAARRLWHRQHKTEALGASLKGGPQ